MEPDAPFEHLLDDPAGLTAGPEQLRAIVARSGRRRTRMAAAGIAGALVIGAATGWALGSSGSRGSTRVVAATPPTTGVATLAPNLMPAMLAGPSFGPFGGLPLTRTFIRTTADGVTIRGYRTNPAELPKGVCAAVLPQLIAELSTRNVVGETGAPGQPGAMSGSSPEVDPTIIGVSEQSPVWVVVVGVGSGKSTSSRSTGSAARVKVAFSDGRSDEMAPIDGWAVLAHVAPARSSAAATSFSATVETLDANNKVVSSIQVTESQGGSSSATGIGVAGRSGGGIFNPGSLSNRSSKVSGEVTSGGAPVAPPTTVVGTASSGSATKVRPNVPPNVIGPCGMSTSPTAVPPVSKGSSATTTKVAP